MEATSPLVAQQTAGFTRDAMMMPTTVVMLASAGSSVRARRQKNTILVTPVQSTLKLAWWPVEDMALQYPALSLRVNRENMLNRVPSKQLIFFNYIHHVQKTSINFNFW